MRVLVACLVLMLIGLGWRLAVGEGSVQALLQLRSEVRAAQVELDSVRTRNQALEAEVADLKSGLEAIEERARSRLGMIGEGETFYQFVRNRGAQSRNEGRSEGHSGSRAGKDAQSGASDRSAPASGKSP